MTFGAGLGAFVQGFTQEAQKSQERQIQMRQLAMQEQQFQQKTDELRRAKDAATAAMSYFGGAPAGAGSQGPAAPPGAPGQPPGQMPYSTPMPQPQMQPGQPSVPMAPSGPAGGPPGASGGGQGMPGPGMPQAAPGGSPGPSPMQPQSQPEQIIGNLARNIKAANPNIDPLTLADAVQQSIGLIKGVQPEVKDQMNLMLTQAKMQFQQQMSEERLGLMRDRLAMSQGAQGDKGWVLKDGPDGKTYRVNQNTGQVVPLDMSLQNMSGKGQGGSRDAMQMTAMTNAANETAAALGNLTDLPITATASLFKGAETDHPKGLAEGFSKSLANKMTPEEAQSVQVSFQGVARAMATLEAAGRATGLVGLTQQAQGLMPQPGDTNLTVLRKYGEIRQIAERSIETIKSKTGADPEQVKLLDRALDQIKTSVPWTVKDVNDLQRKPGDADSARKFFEKIGGSGAGAGAIPPEAIKALKSGQGTPEQFDEIFGPGAAKKALGQ